MFFGSPPSLDRILKGLNGLDLSEAGYAMSKSYDKGF